MACIDPAGDCTYPGILIIAIEAKSAEIRPMLLGLDSDVARSAAGVLH